MCAGAISEFGPEVLPILSETLIQADRLCRAFNFCPPASGATIASKFPRRDESFKRMPRSWTSSSSGFVHVSDIHYDPKYTVSFVFVRFECSNVRMFADAKVGASTTCDEPLCCRTAGSGSPAGIWGDYECDLPFSTIEVRFVSFRSVRAMLNFDSPCSHTSQRSSRSLISFFGLETILRMMCGINPRRTTSRSSAM